MEQIPSFWELITHTYVLVLAFELVMGLITGYLLVKFLGRFF